jgi:cytochrome P450 / NADPH-cytochrome P450 reductase
MSSLAPGDRLHVAIRPSNVAFHLPSDGESIPIICIATGSGLAPFRGFVQERAEILSAGRSLAPALLFFGCREKEKDDLYREEFDEWEALGAVEVRRAYSRNPDSSCGCKYVQDRMWKDREDLARLWKRGAKVFVCGSREVGEGVKETVLRMRMQRAAEEGEGEMTKEEAMRWFEGMRNQRYAMDVFD